MSTSQRDRWQQNPRLFPRDEVAIGNARLDKDYSFLLHSDDTEIGETRKLLESWFSDFPADEKGKWDLYRRFSSNSKKQHFGAFWEMYCFNFLRCERLDIEPHPEMDGDSTHHPDFLASRDGQAILYLESRILWGTSPKESEENSRNLFMADFEKKFRDENIQIWVEFTRTGKSQPSAGEVAERLRRFFRTGKNYPAEFDVEIGDWEIKLSAEKRKDYRGVGDNAVWGSSNGWGSSSTGDVQAIQKALKEKRAGRYSIGKVPYIIALCNLSLSYPELVDYALYGDIENGKRKNDGFFCSNDGVSAVLYIENLAAGNAIEKMPTLFRNPNARNPIPSNLFAACKKNPFLPYLSATSS